MADFTLDTSGGVRLRRDKIRLNTLWSDLSPFAQGYVEAMLSGVVEGAWRLAEMTLAPGDTARVGPHWFRFSDLAPETLAAILKDCEAFPLGLPRVYLDGKHGSQMWVTRQKGEWTEEGFPPLTPYLGDDGKVYLRDAA